MSLPLKIKETERQFNFCSNVTPATNAENKDATTLTKVKN